VYAEIELLSELEVVPEASAANNLPGVSSTYASSNY
jgi:hypothetical protein